MDWWKNLIQKLNKFVPSPFQQMLQTKQDVMQIESTQSEAILALQKRIKMQAMMALAAVALIMLLVFGMSAAWYTNVAKVSDLTFETEAWGFDSEKISIDPGEIKAAPGRSGFVPLTVDNAGSIDGVQVGVTVRKHAARQDELQKRIFFYTDTSYTYDFSAGEDEEEIILPQTEGDEPTAQASDEYIVPTQETVSRIYLGETGAESYTYTILPGQKLALSEDYYNDVPLKWMWAYDMLGYYFRGTVVPADAEADPVVEASLRVDEYIRPIEYDYDHAVFDEMKTLTPDVAPNAETTETEGGTEPITNPSFGQLTMANGLSRDQFLYQLSAADGYQGVITPDLKPVVIQDAESGMADHWYYPIAVDETGTGVWAYLCTRQEVEAGFAVDNQLAGGNADGGAAVEDQPVEDNTGDNTTEERQPAEGNAEDGATEENQPAETEKVSMTATIVLTAINVPANTQQVSSTEEFKASLMDSTTTDVLSLQNNVTLSEAIQLAEGTHKVIDLNGYALEYNGEGRVFDLSDGASLTLMNGSMHSTNSDATAIYSQSADVTLSNMTFTNFYRGIEIRDHISTADQAGDTTLRLAGCNIETENVSVLLRGNGPDTGANTKVIIEDSTIHSNNFVAIYGQGSETNYGTELVVLNSNISGKWGALYHPQQQSVVTITGSVLEGYTGMAIKGGTITITDSEIIGNGDYHAAADSPNGFTDTGDGIYVEATYNWGATVVLKGDRNEIKSTNAYAIDLFGKEGAGPGKVLIYGGKFNGSDEQGDACWNGIGAFEVYGGLKPTDKIVTTEGASIIFREK